MAIASLCLGGVAFFLMILGMIFSMVPVVGAVLSMGAPVLALFGVVTGGLAISRAKTTGESGGVATAGLAVSIVAFLLSLLFALTCGLCNACVSTAMMDPANNNGGVFSQQFGGTCTGPNCPPSSMQPNQGPFQPSPTPVASPPPPPPMPANVVAPGAICDEVRPCCMAFTHGDPTICDGVLAEARQQADPVGACRELASGWASGLEQLGEPVPASCRP